MDSLPDQLFGHQCKTSFYVSKNGERPELVQLSCKDALDYLRHLEGATAELTGDFTVCKYRRAENWFVPCKSYPAPASRLGARVLLQKESAEM
ncbi:MAG: hypothetical protein K0S07_1160 [Chlamydiales bacterium]|nr:hypothetical protein [Chlamydiales bacterium]